MIQPRRHAGAGYPAWVREIDLALPVKPQFLVTGNLRDLHLLPDDDPRSPELVATVDVITDLLVENGYDLILRYDPVDGVQIVEQTAGAAGALALASVKAGGPHEITVRGLTKLLKDVVTDDSHRVALLIDYASRLRVDNQGAGQELQELLAAAEKLAHVAVPYSKPASRVTTLYNPIFWLVDQELDLPHWLSSIEAVRVVSLPLPTLAAREATATRLAGSLPGYAALSDAAKRGVVRRFAENTEGMSVRSMQDVTVLAIDSAIPADRVDEAVRSFRVGVLDNPWRDPGLKSRIAAATGEPRGAAAEKDDEKRLEDRVLGQPRAIRKSLDILMRSTLGLTGSHARGHAGRPQGILFFAGPTGVGKTELAKALAELLFGTDDAYTRFDMSEFSAEQSEARLIGSPPGYVGHDEGGELTNAVRQKPFSILLFDEIEKADPRILDKFLQILEDGRLTDGSGSTVYFSESVIVFTSNLGIYTETDKGVRVATVKPGEPYDSLERKVREAIELHFTRDLGRPELLNRIGDNIVVFDFISPEVGRQLVDIYLGNIVARVHDQLGFTLTIAPEVVETIAHAALADLSFGGRGIGSVVETTFENPLARELFALEPAARAVTVTALVEDQFGWKATVA